MSQKRSRRRPPQHVRRQQSAHKRDAHGSLDWVRDQAHRQIGMDGLEFVFVREVFPDRVIIERDNGTMTERAWSIGDEGSLVLGEPSEVTLEYVAKAEGGPRLSGPFVAKDEAKRLVYGAVLVPGEPDSDGDTLTVEKVEQVAHKWLESFRALDVGHDVEKIDAAPVESYVEPADREVEIDGTTVTLPEGTWTMAAKVHDDDTWSQVTKGEVAGFSIMGVPTGQLEAAMAAVKSGNRAALKRTTLADLGDGDANADSWAVPFVSLVDKPAVPKAKFYAIKRAAGEPVGDEEGAEMSAAQIKDSVKSALDEALKPVTDRLDKLETAGKGDDGTESGTEGGKSGDGGGGKGGAESGDGGESSVDEATKSAITEAVAEAVKPIAEKAERAEKRTRPGSNQPGDGTNDTEPVLKGTAGRDAFGRRIKE